MNLKLLAGEEHDHVCLKTSVIYDNNTQCNRHTMIVSTCMSLRQSLDSRAKCTYFCDLNLTATYANSIFVTYFSDRFFTIAIEIMMRCPAQGLEACACC